MSSTGVLVRSCTCLSPKGVPGPDVHHDPLLQDSRYLGTVHSPDGDKLVPLNSMHGVSLMHASLARGLGLERLTIEPLVGSQLTSQLSTFISLITSLTTQERPSTCGLATLVTCLNSLRIDPGRVWKQPWRWFDETMLLSCSDAAYPKHFGTTMEVFNLLADCNGADVSMMHASELTLEQFRSILVNASKEDNMRAVVSFDRLSLGQTGLGHFSPIGLIDEKEDKALILDVARFKYAPYWVDIPDLFRAMQVVDDSTGKSRGMFLLRNRRAMDSHQDHADTTTVGEAAVHDSQENCKSHEPAAGREVPKSHLLMLYEKVSSRVSEPVESICAAMGVDVNVSREEVLKTLSSERSADAVAFCHDLRRLMVKSLEFRACGPDTSCDCGTDRRTREVESHKSIYLILEQLTQHSDLNASVSSTLKALIPDTNTALFRSCNSDAFIHGRVCDVIARAFPVMAQQVSALYCLSRQTKQVNFLN